uniref:Alpha-carbonic anhydrase domain-containing protein n=1 Tax=Periophthalmus magnuspinnatus TaxID=409849 RepID=A0A3B3ZDH6_9GOBI
MFIFILLVFFAAWCYIGADCSEYRLSYLCIYEFILTFPAIICVMLFCCFHTDEATWGGSCNGNRQSPIEIVSAAAAINRSLTPFTFTNFNNKTALTSIHNSDYTEPKSLNMSGGGLSEEYQTLMFTLHWGNRSSIPGSEHKLNGKRYPMELQIVSFKASSGDIQTALADSNGLAALGFLIEVDETTTGLPVSWKNLTTQLDAIAASGSSLNLSLSLSLDDLLTGVDRTKYYRYLGSLTTPNCDEAVVWTVFKDPVKVSKDLIDLFSTKIKDANSTLIVNNYRSIKPTQPFTYSSTPKTSASFGLLLFALALWKS